MSIPYEMTRNLVVFLIILGSAIAVHELGHLVAALICRIRIREIGIGIPPRLATLGVISGVRVTLNWIPLGGFIRPEGEFDPAKPGGLAAASPWKRMGILGAGAVSNFLFAFAVLVLAFVIAGPSDDSVQIVSVSPGSPAEAAGLLPGDLVSGVDENDVRGVASLRSYVYGHLGEEISLHVERGDRAFSTSLVPRMRWPEGEGAAGFTYREALVPHSLGEAIAEAIEECRNIVQTSAQVLAVAAQGAAEPGEIRVTGPVGLKQASDWTLENSLQWKVSYPVLYFCALLSIGLGMTNLLPLPALDGGRIALALLETLRGKSMDMRVEKWVHAIGIVALMALMLVLSVRDLLDPLF